MHKLWYFLVGFVFLFIACDGCPKKAEEKKQEERKVFFIEPKDNARLTSPFNVKFGVKGLKVLPAGQGVGDNNTGHHHVLINDDNGYVEKGQVVPSDERNIHYGNGEESATLNLTPGTYVLTLQFADGAHVSYGKELTDTITVFVE